MSDYINREKPVLKDAETVCDGCWKVTKDRDGWMYFNFKHLKPVWLCEMCKLDMAEDLSKKQAMGL